MTTGRRLAMRLTCVLLLLLAALACSSRPEPAVPAPDPPRVLDPVGLVSDVNDLLETDPRHDNLRAVLVLLDGRTVVEQYFDWPPDSYWDTGWVTTTVLTTLIGTALGEGLIESTDATLADLLPDRRRDMDERMAAITLAQLLSMASGLPALDRDARSQVLTGREPVSAILRSTDGRSPGGSFDYSQRGAHLLSAVLAEATGMPVLTYARSRLLDPLGIDTRPAYQGLLDDAHLEPYLTAGFAWPVDRTGLQLGWRSLKLRARDMASLGQLFLDRGRWKGRQLVPESWVDQATRTQVDDVGYDAAPMIARGYGYGWWIGEADSQRAFYAADPGGHLIEVVPGRSLVVVVASEPQYDTFGGSGVSPGRLTFIVDDVIAPAVGPVAADPQSGE